MENTLCHFSLIILAEKQKLDKPISHVSKTLGKQALSRVAGRITSILERNLVICDKTSYQFTMYPATLLEEFTPKSHCQK